MYYKMIFAKLSGMQAPGKREAGVLGVQGVRSTPCNFFLNINNDDKLCWFFLRGMYFFHFFHSFFLKILFSTNKNLNSPMAFMHLAKVTQNWHIHLTSRAFGQCPVGHCWIVKYGPAARLKWNKKGRGARKKKLWKRTAYIERLSSRKQKSFP